MTLELARSCAPYVTTIINGSDIVPTISPGDDVLSLFSLCHVLNCICIYISIPYSIFLLMLIFLITVYGILNFILRFHLHFILHFHLHLHFTFPYELILSIVFYSSLRCYLHVRLHSQYTFFGICIFPSGSSFYLYATNMNGSKRSCIPTRVLSPPCYVTAMSGVRWQGKHRGGCDRHAAGKEATAARVCPTAPPLTCEKAKQRKRNVTSSTSPWTLKR
jgi:hypothetical protein